MRNHQGYYLSKIQQQLWEETREKGMTADMLRKWEMHSSEAGLTERLHTYLSMSVDVPASFSVYHKDAAKIMMREDVGPAETIAELNQIKMLEAKAFVLFHQFGLTLKFIRDNRDKFYFNDTSINMLNLLINHEHMTFQQALNEIEGLEPWLFDVVVDFYRDGLRLEDVRGLVTSKETENITRNACLEYSMFKDGRGGVSFLSKSQFIHFVKNVFYGAMKLGASPQEAWILTAGQLQQISMVYGSSLNTFWNAPRSVQAEYLMAGFNEGVAPHRIPVFTCEYWKTYQALRVLHRLSSAEAIAEIRHACPDLDVEPGVRWSDVRRSKVLVRRNDEKIKFLRDHYGEGIRGKDLAGCPFAINAVKECMEHEKIGAKRTLALLNELEPANAQYLLEYSCYGVSFQTIASVDFSHEPTRDEVETFIALVERMRMKPDMAFKRITNLDEKMLKRLREDVSAMMLLDGDVAAREDGRRMRM